MRKFETIIVFLFLSKSIISQINWAPVSAQWTYYGPFDANSYIQIAYDHDTIISGNPAKVLSKTHYIGLEYWDSLIIEDIGQEYTFEEDSVIYLYRNNQFDTLYCFNSAIGDSWKLYCYPSEGGLCNEDAFVTVEDTGTVLINDILLKYIALNYNFGSSWSMHRDTIIERIGPQHSYFLPFSIVDEMLDAAEGGQLRCYTDDVVGTYKNYCDKPCNFLLPVQHMQEFKYLLYPNPARTSVTLEFKEFADEEIKISILDITGILKFKSRANEKKVNIDIRDFVAGVYLIRLTNLKDKELARNFIIKY